MTGFPKSVQDALISFYATRVGDRQKRLEVKYELALKPSQPYIIRLDGVAFSTLTKGISKPFDHRLADAMLKTTIDLVEKFNACLGYHQSDEISLIFPNVMPLQSANDEESMQPNKKKLKTDKIHAYNGRVQKLASVTASYASARLNYHINTHDWSNLKPEILTKITSHTAHFDGRVVPAESLTDLSECIFWRSNFDSIRNAVSHIAQSHFTGKQLHGKSVVEQYALLYEKAGIDLFEEYPASVLFGTWVKKQQYQLKDPVNPKTGQKVLTPVLRSRIRFGSFNWADWSEEDRTSFTVSKFWPDDKIEYLTELENKE